MGYMTEFKLRILDVDDADEVYTEFLATDGTPSYALGPCMGDMGEECKWYDHEKDMKAFSIKYPDAHFVLEGLGEEDGDMWEKHFINGKMQRCEARIEYEPFDPSKLQ